MASTHSLQNNKFISRSVSNEQRKEQTGDVWAKKENKKTEKALPIWRIWSLRSKESKEEGRGGYKKRSQSLIEKWSAMQYDNNGAHSHPHSYLCHASMQACNHLPIQPLASLFFHFQQHGGHATWYKNLGFERMNEWDASSTRTVPVSFSVNSYLLTGSNNCWIMNIKTPLHPIPTHPFSLSLYPTRLNHLETFCSAPPFLQFLLHRRTLNGALPPSAKMRFEHPARVRQHVVTPWFNIFPSGYDIRLFCSNC